MAIIFNPNPAADATFGDLFTDDVGSASWYRLWVGDGTQGNFVDTSAFNSYGNGWIETSDLDALQVDFAQAGDSVLWVQEWDSANGSAAWVNGEIDFSAIDSADVTEEISGNVPLSSLFTALDTGADTQYQIWNGDAAGNQGAYLATEAGNGWLTAAELDDYFYVAESFAGDESFADGFGNFGNDELWIKTWAGDVDYGWEHWTVDNTYGVRALAGVDLGGDTVGLALNTDDGAAPFSTEGPLVSVDADDFGDNAAAEVLRITGDADIRIDLTDPQDQVEELDLDGDGAIEFDGVENDLSGAGVLTVQDFSVFDLYSRNPKNHNDLANNFFGDLEFDGTGFQGDGVDTDGNIVLSGQGADTIFGGIGNDFIAAGGVVSGSDVVSGGRNADFFFVEVSALDQTDGTSLWIDGGLTWDNDPSQDSDWILGEFSDDDEPVYVDLSDDTGQVSYEGDINTRSGFDVQTSEIENFDASGNLYGFLNDFDVVLGGAAEYNSAHAADGTENSGLGSTAQLVIDGSASDNIIVAGFDNDTVDGDAGDDVLLGGNMQYLEDNQNNPNILEIPNDGRDTLLGGAGDDDILFEIDGGTIDGEADNDTLFLTDYTLGASSNDLSDMTDDNRIRLDLGAQAGVETFAGYGGADSDADLTDFDGTADQSNYTSSSSRVDVDNMENIIATGLGDIDYDVDGGNALIDDPADHNFTDQMNFFGIDENLDLRGTNGDNILYANTGDDVLEGREGNDMLSGGNGNDDFIFQLDGDGAGDDLDIIHRQQDDNLDNLWDEDADGQVLYAQDFGTNIEIIPSDSTLSLTMRDTLAPANELLDIPVSGIIFQLDGVSYTVGSDVMGTIVTYDAFVDELRTLFAADSALAGLVVADYNAADNGTITITDPAGGVFVTEGYTWVDGVQPPVGDIDWSMAIGDPIIDQPIDRLVFAAYEDRNDGELVDDDGFVNSTGDAVSLGGDGYAEDIVARFDSDGNGTTILAEDQQWDVEFENLADEDTISISVNGTEYTLQMGVRADGTAIEETMPQFLDRMVDLINAGSDNDTLAGTLQAALGNGATAAVNDTIILTQGNYNGGQVVFMDEPIVDIGNASGGEPASVVITNRADSEITLFEFDGRDNNLDDANVLFLGGSGMNDGVVTNAANSRSIFETAADAGGEINGSDALIVDSMTDADTIVTDFALHGDDSIFTGAGNDIVSTGTGDDTIYGSVGTDTVDGGKDIYVIQTLVSGEIVETTEVMNEYEAAQRATDSGIIDVSLIEQDAWDGAQAGYDDTLVFSTADFSGTRFTVTVDDDLFQQEGGAGTVSVDEDDDGIFNHTTSFVEMEAIRTLAGDGTHAGQGHDTLNVEDLSDAVEDSDSGDPDAAVVYNMTSELGFIQINADLNDDDEINDDPDQNPANADTDDENDTFLAVDGVERFIGGNANEQLNIDESEVLKDNYFDGDDEVTLTDDDDAATTDDPDLDGDSIVYDHTDMDNDGVADDDGVIDDGAGNFLFNDDVAVSMRPSMEVVIESDTETDMVNMTGGTIIGSDTTIDTLIDVETINVANAAFSATLEDTLNVSNINGAYVDFTDGQVRDGSEVLARITGMSELEETQGGSGDDTVEVADNMANYKAYDSDNATTAISYDSWMTYDTVADETGARQGLSVVPTADRPEANNQGLFTFDLGEGNDRVDYSLESDNIAAVVDFETITDTQTLFVLGGDLELTAADDRIDLLRNVDETVASQGVSILDFTGAATDIEVTFQYDENNGIDSIDRMESIIRIADGDGDTIDGLGAFIEYYDMGDDDDVDPFVNATWNQVEGSDFGDTVIYQGSEDLINDAGQDHRFSNDTLNLRGGTNVVSYSALETSITAVITVTESDADALVAMPGDADLTYATGSIVTTVGFQDGESGVLAGGGRHTINSYTSDNDVAAGNLKIEASQDAEDTVSFASGSDKLFILGTSAGVLDVQIGTLDTMRLTGFEFLQDAGSNDTYQFDNLITGMQYLDNAAADTDTIVVGNDAIGFDNLAAPQNDDIDLGELSTEINIDFDILDVTGVTSGDVDLVGGSPGTEAETVVLDDLSLFDNITLFETIKLGEGTTVTGTLDIDLGTSIMSDAGNSINIDGNISALDFADMTTDTTVEITSPGLFTITGGSGNDFITGGAGSDIISGGAGDDIIDAGIATEVRQFNFDHTLAADGNNAFFNFMGQGNLTIVEGVDFVSGAGEDAVGTAVATVLNADLAQATLDFQAVSGGTEAITDISYDETSDLLTFTFDSGVDVTTPIDLGYNDNGDTGSGGDFTISAENTLTEGGTGGNNLFYGGAGVDNITGGGANDVFVVVGEVDADDYTAATGVALQFDAAVDAIENGQAVSDISTDIIAGDLGTDTISVWGNVDFTAATISGIEILDINSNVTFTDAQIADMLGITGALGSILNIVGDTGSTEYAWDVDNAEFVDGNGNALEYGPENTAPVAENDTFETGVDTAIVLDVLANDTDADSDDLSIVAVTPIDATIGTVATDGDQILFTPAAGYEGDVSFAYQITDGTDTANASVTGTVVGAINNAPVAVADTDAFTVAQGESVVINSADLLANDTDADGDVLTITAVNDLTTGDGTAELSADGLTITFTADAGHEGAASFAYQVSDGVDLSNGATVSGTVTAGPVETTVDVTAADNGSVYSALDTAIETFNIGNASSYAYSIEGFELGVDVIDMPDGATINNTALDGEAGLQYASAGVVVDITLTGLTNAEDLLLTTAAGWGDSWV